jgi:hypothetical protein
MMRVLAACLAAIVAAAAAGAATLYVDDLGDGAVGTGTEEDPFRDLQAAIETASDGDVLVLLPGAYDAAPVEYVENLCGNCEKHRTEVRATRGFLVEDKALHIVGSGPGSTTLVTNAGYGLLFVRSEGSYVSGLTITGGRRDLDGMATDAGVVVRESQVTLKGIEIVDNTDRPEEVVVGIGGVMGREGAEITIVGNVIRNNGWDGVALYRGATAFIADNVIADGRGAGIGITWDAAAIVLRNRISGYWKGIGTFGSSRAVVRNNAVFDNLGWGVIATGTSFMEAANNVITRNGNCGFALWSDEAIVDFANNIVVENGWRDEWVCPKVGVWLNGDASNLSFAHNDVWGNAAGDYRGIDDLSGVDGNASFDPLFADSLDFHLSPESPAIDAGAAIFTDPDGGPSDLGIHGGPAAR